jgi:hypothetical protein
MFLFDLSDLGLGRWRVLLGSLRPALDPLLKAAEAFSETFTEFR